MSRNYSLKLLLKATTGGTQMMHLTMAFGDKVICEVCSNEDPQFLVCGIHRKPFLCFESRLSGLAYHDWPR